MQELAKFKQVTDNLYLNKVMFGLMILDIKKTSDYCACQ